MDKYFSKSVKDTIKLAENIAKKIKKGTIILLHGDLGAGKTHFVKGLAKGLNDRSQVTSPTFTIMNSYEGGKMPIYHFDMYRLNSADEAREAGLEEYFDINNLDGISVVEWSENVPGLIKGKVVDITIEKTFKEDERIITIGEKLC